MIQKKKHKKWCLTCSRWPLRLYLLKTSWIFNRLQATLWLMFYLKSCCIHRNSLGLLFLHVHHCCWVKQLSVYILMYLHVMLFCFVCRITFIINLKYFGQRNPDANQTCFFTSTLKFNNIISIMGNRTCRSKMLSVVFLGYFSFF